MNFSVRKATPADVESIVDLCIKLAKYESNFINNVVNEEEIRKRVSYEVLFDVHCAYFVAEVNSKIVGVIKVAEKEGWLARISEAYVEEGYRSRGIMSALLEKALEWAKERGRSNVYLTVVEGNDRAYNFWKSKGFEFCGYAGKHLIKMNLDLSKLAS